MIIIASGILLFLELLFVIETLLLVQHRDVAPSTDPVRSAAGPSGWEP